MILCGSRLAGKLMLCCAIAYQRSGDDRGSPPASQLSESTVRAGQSESQLGGRTSSPRPPSTPVTSAGCKVESTTHKSALGGHHDSINPARVRSRSLALGDFCKAGG